MSFAGKLGRKRRRGPGTQALVAIGGGVATSVALAAAAIVRVRLTRGRQLHATTTVRADAAETYRRWRDLPKLPLFMTHLSEVSTLDATHSRWTAHGPDGTTLRWDAEITEDVPGSVIAWRSLPGARVPTRGRVTFTPAGEGRTDVRVEIEYDRPAGTGAAVVAMLAGADPSHQLRADLRRFTELVETGAVRTVDVPEVPHLRRLVSQRTARSE